MSDTTDSRRTTREGTTNRRTVLTGTVLGALGVLPGASASPGNGGGSGNEGNGNGDGNVDGTPVLDWSQLALDSIIETGIVIPDSGRFYAIVHAAIHDAVNGINQARGEGFDAREQIVVDDEEPPVPGASRVAAAAAAARTAHDEALDGYIEERAIDEDDVDARTDASAELLDDWLDADTDGNTHAGEEWGETVADAVLDARDGSGFFEPDDITEDEDYEYDAETLEPGQGQVLAGWGNSNLAFLDPWAIDDPQDIRDSAAPEGGSYEDDIAPPDLESVFWAVDYNKTKLLGDFRAGKRDPGVFELTLGADDVDGLEGDLEDVVDWIEDRPTAISVRGFDNERIGETEHNDDGELTSVTVEFERPDDFQDLGNFWVALSGTAQPDGRWLQIAHALSRREGLGFTTNAELLADVALAAVDGAVTGWNTKRKYGNTVSWRPHAPIDSNDKNGGIQDDDPPTAADDGNPLTEPDPEWTAISGHAASGEHPSGLTLASTAAQVVLDDYFPAFDEDTDEFDPDETFAVEVLPSGEGVGDDPDPVTEEFSSFEEARRIAMDTREYTGRHYRYSLEASARMGRAVAEAILDR